MSVKLATIAEKAGVSVAAVSKALNNRTDIAPATRKRIQTIARELGYSCHFAARTLSTRKTCTVGVVLPFPHIPAVIARLRGIQVAAGKSGYVTTVSFHGGDPEDETREISVLQGRVDGIILTPVSDARERAGFIEGLGMPVVQMSETINGLRADYVGDDDFEGGRIAALHFIETGAKKPAYFAATDEGASDRLIIRGMRSVLAEHKLAMEKKRIFRGNVDKETIRENVLSMLKKKDRPDAICCFSDNVALWVIENLLVNNIQVPDDIRVLGYDNIEFSAIARIPLSTISQPNHEIGRNAMQMMLERLADPDTPRPPRKLIFPPELIVRKSTERTVDGR